MKCPYCHIMPTGERRGIVRFDCGMAMAIEIVQQRPIPPDVIESYRNLQPPACIRGERDRYIRRLLREQAKAKAMRDAGDALARHVAEDTRGQAARQLAQAWEEARR